MANPAVAAQLPPVVPTITLYAPLINKTDYLPLTTEQREEIRRMQKEADKLVYFSLPGSSPSEPDSSFVYHLRTPTETLRKNLLEKNLKRRFEEEGEEKAIEAAIASDYRVNPDGWRTIYMKHAIALDMEEAKVLEVHRAEKRLKSRLTAEATVLMQEAAFDNAIFSCILDYLI